MYALPIQSRILITDFIINQNNKWIPNEGISLIPTRLELRMANMVKVAH
jgi:predicted acetyltransferase